MNSKKKLKVSKKQGLRSRSKFISQTLTQSSTLNSESSNDSSKESNVNPSLTVVTIDEQWVKREELVKALVELENRKMIGQAMHDYIIENNMQYQSITLMAILKNWRNI